MNLFPPFYRFRFFSQPSPLLFLVYNILCSKPFICKLAPLLICSWQLSSVMYTKHYITPNLALRWTNTPTTISCAITLPHPSHNCFNRFGLILFLDAHHRLHSQQQSGVRLQSSPYIWQLKCPSMVGQKDAKRWGKIVKTNLFGSEDRTSSTLTAFTRLYSISTYRLRINVISADILSRGWYSSPFFNYQWADSFSCLDSYSGT